MLDPATQFTQPTSHDGSCPATVPMQVIYLLGPGSPREWLPRALADQTTQDIELVEVPSALICLERLRTRAFDVVLIDRELCESQAHALFAAIRQASHEHLAIVVLDDDPTRRLAAECLEQGATQYLSLRSTSPRELILHLQRAAAWSRLQREADQLKAAQHRQQRREEQETSELLAEQVGWVQRLLERNSDRQRLPALSPAQLESLQRHGLELLQNFAVLEPSQVEAEIRQFTRLIVDYQLGLEQIFDLVTHLLETILPRRGLRSARHIFARSHLLLMQILVAWSQQQEAPSATHTSTSHTPASPTRPLSTPRRVA